MSAWTPPEFAEAVTALAKARGVSRSELIREALCREALATASFPEADDPDRADST